MLERRLNVDMANLRRGVRPHLIANAIRSGLSRKPKPS